MVKLFNIASFGVVSDGLLCTGRVNSITYFELAPEGVNDSEQHLLMRNCRVG